jgi:hypothetical protein
MNGKKLNGMDYLLYPAVDTRIMLIWLIEKQGIHRIKMCQAKIKWQASVNMVKELRVPYEEGNFLTS